ncbi:MAG: DedA family protein [Rikenellaceae bacterium]|nr:DedA family protein [Rikenellaceae bacterium]
MESVHFIEWCLENLNYWTITLLMAIESSFIPFPSEVVIPPAAYKAAAGELNIVLVVLFGTIGALIGAFINYFLAYYLGRPVIYKLVNTRFGRLCLLDEHKIHNAEEYFVKNGAVSTFVGRLIPAIRQLISIPAGLAKMSLKKFVLYTSLGALMWNMILAAVGYSLQSFVPKDQLMSKVHEYSSEISNGMIVLGVLVFLYLLYKALGKPKNANESK